MWQGGLVLPLSMSTDDGQRTFVLGILTWSPLESMETVSQFYPQLEVGLSSFDF
jgi:hypothetical protein